MNIDTPRLIAVTGSAVFIMATLMLFFIGANIETADMCRGMLVALSANLLTNYKMKNQLKKDTKNE
jgi:hypothetical protein